MSASGGIIINMAGGIVVNKEGQILLVYQHGNSWCFPKGRVEEGEEILNAAKREIYEETGISKLELIEKLGEYERSSMSLSVRDDITKPMRKRHVFLFYTEEENTKTLDKKEITEMKWCSLDNVSRLLTHPKDKEFFLSVKSRVESFITSRQDFLQVRAVSESKTG